MSVDHEDIKIGNGKSICSLGFVFGWMKRKTNFLRLTIFLLTVYILACVSVFSSDSEGDTIKYCVQ